MASQLPHRLLKDRRTKNLTRRLKPGDIALINHPDLDTTAARALIESRIFAVVNAAKSVTGRYPNRGPSLLLEAGIPILDHIGEEAFNAVPDAQPALFCGDSLQLADGKCLPGTPLDAKALECALLAAADNLGAEFDKFARNTLDYIGAEKELLFSPVEVPPLKTHFADKHVLIIVRGEGYKEDLSMLRDYLREARPVLLAVDGGADALLEAKLKPNIIFGDMDSVSDKALRCGAELIVHGYPKSDKRGAPGLERLQKLNLKSAVLHSPGTSEDVAMLLADELGAKLIVAVGTHFSLEEFLDKGRDGMASTFLTRLRIGSKLVDAKGIARLWSQQRPRFGELALVVFAAATPIVAVLMLSPMGQIVLNYLRTWFGYRYR